MTYYKQITPDGKWEVISEEKLLAVINSHFPENESKSWDGSTTPSRKTVIEYIKSGKVLHLYTANYKCEK